jgi:hypothetical protein
MPTHSDLSELKRSLWKSQDDAYDLVKSIDSKHVAAAMFDRQATAAKLTNDEDVKRLVTRMLDRTAYLLRDNEIPLLGLAAEDWNTAVDWIYDDETAVRKP